MTEKIRKIIYWVLTGLVSLVFLGSSAGKLSANVGSLKMAADFGIDPKTNIALGIVELFSLMLFVFPRTGILGTILLASYMGGAIATHIEHAIPIVAPVIIQTFLLLVAFYRFPELRMRSLNSVQ